LSTIDWNERYQTGDLPWDAGTPDPHLVRHVSASTTRGRALDVGSGTGTNAIWLARKGFEVLGVDVSPEAIAQARAKLGGEALPLRFAVADFLAGESSETGFDLVFDRGCFHVFDEAEERARFASRVAEALSPTGRWLSLIGSTEGPPREEGPPRRSVRDIAQAVEPALELLEVVAVPFHAETPERAAGWLCTARRRTVPAQPSTRR
jgi:SAM-dependent methyltransferase